MPGSSRCESINVEEDEIPTIDMTNDAIIEYVGDHIYIENHKGNISTSCNSAHDTDSTFSSIINIDEIIIQDIINEQAEWESKFSTSSQSSRPTERIPIDESDGNGPHRHTSFDNPMSSISSRESDQKHEVQAALESQLEEQTQQLLLGSFRYQSQAFEIINQTHG